MLGAAWHLGATSPDSTAFHSQSSWAAPAHLSWPPQATWVRRQQALEAATTEKCRDNLAATPWHTSCLWLKPGESRPSFLGTHWHPRPQRWTQHMADTSRSSWDTGSQMVNSRVATSSTCRQQLCVPISRQSRASCAGPSAKGLWASLSQQGFCHQPAVSSVLLLQMMGALQAHPTRKQSSGMHANSG